MENFFDSICEMLHGIESYHDSYTMQHENRTGKLMHILALEIGLDAEHSQALEKVGSIHDIGKVALPPYILEKQGSLSIFERQTIELHAKIGYELVRKLNHPLGDLAAIVTLNHHESYDGSGYPNSLKGEDIPLEGRICRICDVYDALRFYRPYRLTSVGDPHESAIKLMIDTTKNGMASKFDPTLLEAFQNIRDKYEHIYTDT